MPFKTFFDWLFDGRLDSPIPQKKIDSEGNVIIPDILSSSSPPKLNFLLSLFKKHDKITIFLDTYFNNVNLWYLEKEEFMKYLKKIVIENRISRYDLSHKKKREERTKLFTILSEKTPHLKTYDVSLLCDIIERSDKKEQVFQTLEITIPKKKKLKIEKKQRKNKKISLKELLDGNFSMVEHEEAPI